jgi:hypothetical protein
MTWGNMTNLNSLFAAAAVAATLATNLASTPAHADDTGVAQSLHTVARVGGRQCLIDHAHAGSSAGLPSERAAKAEAIKSWAGFTAWEYGTDWANFRKAIKVSMRCSQSSSGWGCELSANPCK